MCNSKKTGNPQLVFHKTLACHTNTKEFHKISSTATCKERKWARQALLPADNLYSPKAGPVKQESGQGRLAAMYFEYKYSMGLNEIIW